MTVSLNGTTGVTFPDASIQNTAATGFGFKNRILNGSMAIDQRNAGASVTPTNGQYLVDRWYAGLTQASKFTVQQSSTAPAGFTKSLLVTSSSAYSVGSGDTFLIGQTIEGYNCADLAWGSTSAATVTLSFWVRSSLTGTFGGSINAADGATYSYPFSYTISAANTWEQKTVTVAGPTSTWSAGTTNNGSVQVRFGLGSGSTYSGSAGSWAASNYIQSTGSTSVVGTNGATFYITGVQLEKGSTATSFDYRPYGTELALCQRYFWRQSYVNSYGGVVCMGQIQATTSARGVITFPVTMRTAPTWTVGTIANVLVQNGTANYVPTGYAAFSTSAEGIYAGFTISGATVGQGSAIYQSSDANSTFSAEL